MSSLIQFDPFGGSRSRMGSALADLLDRSFIGPRLWSDEDLPAGTLALNVRDDEKNIVVEAAVPGVKENDLDVRVSGNRLTISAEVKQEESRKGDGIIVEERHYGQFQRSFTLPTEVNPDKVTAELSNGILTITLPKTQASSVRKIAVKGHKLLPSKVK